MEENTIAPNCLPIQSKTATKRPLSESDNILIISDEECKDVANNKVDAVPENTDNVSDVFNSSRTTTVSKFFNPSEDSSKQPPKEKKKRTTKKSIKEKLTDEPKPKKNTRKRKQTTIKTAFARNEQIFTELMAKHSVAENFNPEEMQIALACSMSEAQCSSMDANTEYENGIICTKENANKIREKLQQFGFKTNSKSQDYDIKYLLPKGRGKTKWANKFTSLTMRCPDKQKKKLDDNVEKFLNSQFDETELCDQPPFQLKITSSYLKDLLPESVTIKYFRKCLYMDEEIEHFYVTDLFKPTKSKPGSLLKNYKNIPGRDFSPERSKNCSEHDGYKISMAEQAIDVDECMTDVQSKYQSVDSNDLMLCEDNIKVVKNKFQNMNSLKSSQTDSTGVSPQCKRSKIEQDPRAESPDLFSNSDDDTDDIPSNSANALLNVRNSCKGNLKSSQNGMRLANCSSECDQIMLYEHFSSDEVKVFEAIPKTASPNQTNCSRNQDTATNIVDLTQSDGEEYNKSEAQNSSCSLVEENPINLSFEGSSNVDESKPIIETIAKQSAKITDNENTTTNRFDVDEENCLVLPISPIKLLEQTNKSTPRQFAALESNEKTKSTKKSSNEPEYFCDLTQEDNWGTSQSSSKIDSDSCIILSDDEVNYSIINSAKKKAKKNLSHLFENRSPLKPFDEQRETNTPNDLEVSFLDFVDTQPAYDENVAKIKANLLNESHLEILEDNLSDVSDSSAPVTPSKSFSLSKPNRVNDSVFKTPSPVKRQKGPTSEKSTEDFDLAAECSFLEDVKEETFNLHTLRRKYGIQSTKKSTTGCRKSLSESFLRIDQNLSKFHRSSTCQNIEDSMTQVPSVSNELLNASQSDFDEFDKMCYGSPAKYTASNANRPKDFENLLSAKINEIENSPVKPKSTVETQYEFENDGKIYLIKTENVSPKPDFKRMDSPTRLKELHRFGLKPLSRSKTIALLEHIYNQTHPIVIEATNSTDELAREENKSSGVNRIVSFEVTASPKSSKPNSLELKDYFGYEFLNDEHIGSVADCSTEEIILQTNISKKISTALLPFHVAWFNLFHSNVHLRETILHYEPIDLQEIHIFFKTLGYRYDPKDMKRYFDKKCIIFQYDINKANNTTANTRHRHKKKNPE